MERKVWIVDLPIHVVADTEDEALALFDGLEDGPAWLDQRTLNAGRQRRGLYYINLPEHAVDAGYVLTEDGPR